MNMHLESFITFEKLNVTKHMTIFGKRALFYFSIRSVGDDT